MEREKITIEKVTEIQPIDGSDSTECAIVRNWSVVVPKAAFKKDYWCLLVHGKLKALLPISILNEVYVEPEMVLGISSITGGKIVQLGPYEDALIVQEGVDVTHLVDSEDYLE